MLNLQKLIGEISDHCELMQAVTIMWAVREWTITGKPIFMDKALICCRHWKIPITPTLQEQVMEVAAVRYANKANGIKEKGTVGDVERSLREWMQIIFMGRLIHAGLTVEKAAEETHERFGRPSVDALMQYWGRKIDPVQKEILNNFYQSLSEHPDKFDLEVLLSSIPNPRK